MLFYKVIKNAFFNQLINFKNTLHQKEDQASLGLKPFNQSASDSLID